MPMIELVLTLLRLRFQLRLHDRWSRRELDFYQARSLRLLRRYAYTYSPFYREFHKGLYDRPLHELPVLTKAIAMDRFDDLVTDRVIRLVDVEEHFKTLSGNQQFRARYWLNATSGSTGERGLFLFDPVEWATVIAGFGRADQWAGIDRRLLRRTRVATVASRTPWHMSFRAIKTLDNPWVPLLCLDAAEPVGFLVEALNGWKPQILAGYPSSLRVLAKEQLAGRLRIHPTLLYAGGEVLCEETRRHAFEAWETMIFNQYGTTEAGNVASQCGHQEGLHINEDLLILEVVDEDNHPVPPGRTGEKLLVTVLFNRTQPLIRYELSDRVRLASAPCVCGKPFRLIEDIQGRAEEMLQFPTPSGGHIAVHPLAFEHHLDAVSAAEWQIVQEPDRLLILLSGVEESFHEETLAESLRIELAAQGAVVPAVEVRRVSSIPRGATGKAPIIRKERLP